MSLFRYSPMPVKPWVVLLVVALLSGCAIDAGSGSNSAEKDIDQALKLNITMAIEYMEQGNLPRAQTKLDRALEINPDAPKALQVQALLYQRQGESAMADRFFRQALAMDPTFTQGRNNYAAFLYSQGRVEESCDQLERASQDVKYNNRAQLLTNLGLCQWELGAIPAARASLTRAQTIDPRSPRSYLVMARIDHAQGNYSQAWEQLQSYIRLAGATSESLQLAEQLAQARGDNDSAAFYSRQLDAQNAP
ncbi:type IV pilus biogenesis/stability protein PilW [Halomonas sp. GXIMD04776]|uniref:type IV pilus biogenesis/stability protein PilW n=1 Tax=Halomonas sp. GXIMD04776 TaxID=3415605 RepID=UPI003CA32827